MGCSLYIGATCFWQLRAPHNAICEALLENALQLRTQHALKGRDADAVARTRGLATLAGGGSSKLGPP